MTSIANHICKLSRTRRVLHTFNKRLFCADGIQYKAKIPQRLIHRHDFERFLTSYDNFFLDCDGVLWQTDHVTPLGGISQTIELLHSLNKRLVYVTNNSMHGRSMYVKKFKKYGFEAAIENIFGVAYAAAVYLKKVSKVTKKVYVLGSKGMVEEMDLLNIDHFGYGPDPDKPSWDPEELLKMEFSDDVGAVLIGFDEFFNYNKIFKAASYLTDNSCLYVATNNIESGVLIAPNRRQPLTACLVTAVTAASKREPVVLGKPNTLLFDCIVEQYPSLVKNRTVFIGDSLKADVAFANNVGIDSALVLTGSTTLEMLKAMPNLQPTYILDSLADLCK
ncbi:hypothetical protein CHS0354_035456 [Potamilus streckersoni]|uniref:Phosphoglycolate phosphatase n=1 Tax=Potamilus streckersoni TaxID=2493646 RepID=A0AAE0TEX2_9BIVA|nr:hypothetical protein CHS0354_035456 [Potamilus streckersoni]